MRTFFLRLMQNANNPAHLPKETRRSCQGRVCHAHLRSLWHGLVRIFHETPG